MRTVYCQRCNQSANRPDGRLSLLKGLDRSFTDISFKLSARGGLVVDFELKNGKIEHLTVTGNEFCPLNEVTVTLPDYLGDTVVIPVIK